MVAALSTWPWENLGNFKYLLYGPLIAKVIYSRRAEEVLPQQEDWCLHLLIICALRFAVYTVMTNDSNNHDQYLKIRILPHGVGFKQIDSEWHWDNFIILQAFMAFLACSSFPFLVDLPLWNWKGVLVALTLHVGISEPLYYWFHRYLHTDYLFKNYHSLHHSSPVSQCVTAGHATPLEHIILGLIIGIPIFGTCLTGLGSLRLIYGYIFIFDFLRALGHSSIESTPLWIFKAFPFLRYVFYTATYHNVHHRELDTNFCLFMPLFDALGGTLNKKSWELHQQTRSGAFMPKPDFVFLCHCVDVISSLHVPFFSRSFVSLPYTTRLLVLPWWPIAFIGMIAVWFKTTAIMVTGYELRGKTHHSWCVPRYGFQYFLPFAKDGINKCIENAIIKADQTGVKVISLAALNKNEALNGGGALFVKNLPNLRVRVVHGNTLTAAVILKELPEDTKEIFLTGATSKLGRAIALYLCRHKVRVMMLTQANERFEKIKMEAPEEFQRYLVQVTKYEAAQNCKTWVVGKWLTLGQQRFAPPGTHFHQFVVPSVIPFRRDCTYGELAAMRLPPDVEGQGTCEYTMDRGVVHACHAGGVVHFLEGYTHHEVGTIDVDMIDVVWDAAMKHGLRPV